MKTFRHLTISRAAIVHCEFNSLRLCSPAAIAFTITSATKTALNDLKLNVFV